MRNSQSSRTYQKAHSDKETSKARKDDRASREATAEATSQAYKGGTAETKPEANSSCARAVSDHEALLKTFADKWQASAGASQDLQAETGRTGAQTKFTVSRKFRCCFADNEQPQDVRSADNGRQNMRSLLASPQLEV